MIRLFSGALIFFFGFVIFSGVNGAPIGSFINIHGILLAFFFIASGFIASNWTIADIKNVLCNKTEDEKHALRLIEMVSFFEKISIISSIIGLVTGAVIILSNLGGASHIGPALAVTVLMPFYCMVFYLFAAVLKSKVKFAALKGQFNLK